MDNEFVWIPRNDEAWNSILYHPWVNSEDQKVFVYTATDLMPQARLYVQSGPLDHALRLVLNTKRIRFAMDAAFQPPRLESEKEPLPVVLHKKPRL